MRSSLSVRRASYAALSAGLLAGVLVPLTNASAASCASWTDPKGDSTTRQSGQALLADSQLDIVSAAFGTVGKNVVGTITTDGLGGSSSDAGDEFRFRFTIAEQDVILYVDRVAPPLLGEVDLVAGFYNFTTDETGDAEATFDVKTKTVTLVGAVEQLTAAVGKPAGGQVVSNLKAETFAQVQGATIAKYDEAVTPVKPVVGTACTLGGAPAPAATGGASSAPSPAASGSPSPKPSGTAAPSSGPSPTGSASPASSAAASASPTGPPPAPVPTVPVPASGCFGFTDVKGDARPVGGQAPNEPDLDLLAVTGRTSSTALAGHLQIDKLAAKPAGPAFTGHRFEYQFSVGGKVVLLRATETGPGEGLVDGSVVPDLKVTAAFDIVSSQVVLSVERAGLAKALGRELPEGTFLEAQVARSIARSPGVAFGTDTATTDDAGRARYTVGDNTCFAPKISVSLPGQVQTSDSALVSVSMTTSDGRIAAGQTVTARVGSSRSVSAKTDEQGNATLVAPVTDAAGSRLLVVRTSGSAGRGELTSPMDVVAERTLLSLSARGTGTARTVTAALTDDDRPRRALAGQRVVFSFAGRTVAVTTDAAGLASTRVPSGTAVEATYAGRSGFLTAAKARARA